MISEYIPVFRLALDLHTALCPPSCPSPLGNLGPPMGQPHTSHHTLYAVTGFTPQAQTTRLSQQASRQSLHSLANLLWPKRQFSGAGLTCRYLMPLILRNRAASNQMTDSDDVWINFLFRWCHFSEQKGLRIRINWVTCSANKAVSSIANILYSDECCQLCFYLGTCKSLPWRSPGTWQPLVAIIPLQSQPHITNDWFNSDTNIVDKIQRFLCVVSSNLWQCPIENNFTNTRNDIHKRTPNVETFCTGRIYVQ